MTFAWQDAIALGAVLAAVVYVLRHVRRTGTRKKPTGCGSCADCRVQPRRGPLVSIDPRGKP